MVDEEGERPLGLVERCLNRLEAAQTAASPRSVCSPSSSIARRAPSSVVAAVGARVHVVRARSNDRIGRVLRRARVSRRRGMTTRATTTHRSIGTLPREGPQIALEAP